LKPAVSNTKAVSNNAQRLFTVAALLECAASGHACLHVILSQLTPHHFP
jgi:hypothetical protein